MYISRNSKVFINDPENKLHFIKTFHFGIEVLLPQYFLDITVLSLIWIKEITSLIWIPEWESFIKFPPF